MSIWLLLPVIHRRHLCAERAGKSIGNLIRLREWQLLRHVIGFVL